MTIAQSVECVESSSLFEEWHKEHSDAYLVHYFESDGEKQLGYYNPKSDRITTFVLKDPLESTEEEEAYKSEGKIKPLVIEDLKITLDEAREKAKQAQQEHYPKELPGKEILVVQSIEAGQCFNFTYLTATFKTLNIRIDTKTGDILSHDLKALMDFA